MKKIMFATIVVLMLASCSKKDVGTTSTDTKLSMDASYAGQTFSSPRVKVLIAKMSYLPGTGNKGIAKLLHSFAFTGMTIGSVRNFYTRITKEGDSINSVYTSPSYTPAIKGETINTDGRFLSVREGTKYTIWWYCDVTDQMVGTLQLKTNVEYLTSGSNKTTDAAFGQVIKFVNGTVSTSVDPSTPVSGNVLANQPVETLIFKAVAGQSCTSASIDCMIADPSIVQSATLYDVVTNAQLGTTIVTGSTFSFTPNVPMTQGNPVLLGVRLLLKPITSSSQTGANVKTSLVKFTYQTQTGELRSNDTVRMGNNLYVSKSLPTITPMQISNPVIVDSIAMDVYKFSVTASSSGDIAIRTFTLGLQFGDQYSNNTLGFRRPRLFVGTTDITSFLQFLHDNGEEDSVFTESDTKLRIVPKGTSLYGTNEINIPAGSSRVITVRFQPIGFTNSGDGDEVSISFIGDVVPTYSKFLNAGTVGKHVKLHTSSGTDATAQVFNFIYSDKTSSSHSANLLISSNDWKNGSFITITNPVQNLYQ